MVITKKICSSKLLQIVLLKILYKMVLWKLRGENRLVSPASSLPSQVSVWQTNPCELADQGDDNT